MGNYIKLRPHRPNLVNCARFFIQKQAYLCKDMGNFQ